MGDVCILFTGLTLGTSSGVGDSLLFGRRDERRSGAGGPSASQIGGDAHSRSVCVGPV